MKLYLKLALEGVRKNRRLYTPYVLIGGVMVMMHYILATLSTTPMLRQLRGGGFLRTLLPYGVWVIAAFAAVFLLYCSSFIIRQRNREFGLFSVLGMSRRNLSALVLTENLLTGSATIVVGLLLGMALEKLAEAGMVRLIGESADYELRIDGAAVVRTILIFAGIEALLTLRAMLRVWRTDPVRMLQDSSVGEKPPRANWLAGLAGGVLLAWAYFMAVTLKQPMEAIEVFFRAVLMVIAATYLLFIAGSVALCRLLQRSKRYYYRPNHFVSVASMAYRMKRNGAGLASICILLTVVLVMLSSTLSLCIGAEDALLARYPYDVSVEASIGEQAQMTEENFAARRALMLRLAPEQTEPFEHVRGELFGLFTQEGLLFRADSETERRPEAASLGTLCIIPLADYNRMCGQETVLADDECLLLCWNADFDHPTFTLQGFAPMRVLSVSSVGALISSAATVTYPTITLVTPLAEEMIHRLMAEEGANGVRVKWSYSFNVPEDSDAALALYDPLMEHMRELAFPREQGGFSYGLFIREMEREQFYGMYGGLFFIGVMLSIVFIAAAVLIIYYKQLSEGYEDQRRFAIMQKIGMTKREIRRSVNSQVLTVFFAPLLLAGLHLAFAFPLMWKLLTLFSLSNMPLVMAVAACSFAVFGALYAAVYKLTSNAYFAIVSGGQEHA